MLELITFDSVLEENIFVDLATTVQHISVFMLAHEASLRLGVAGALRRASPPKKSPGAVF